MIFSFSKNWTDEAIIEGIAGGGRHENDALIQLYNKYNSSLKRFISFRNSDFEKAKQPDDIVWETIEAFVINVKKGTYKYGDASLETYLTSISKNILFRSISSETSRRERQLKYLGEESAFDGDVSELLIEKENWEKYINIVSQAGKNCRLILDLRLIEGLSMQEIAEKLIKEGVFESEQVVRNTKSKCLKKMFELLGEI
jgi:RNA polymerase sigma factor (sigma-70 family)